jgi:hypothetical protein
MTPREFPDTAVQPNSDDFDDNFADPRHAQNAVASVDALAAHIHLWVKATDPTAVDCARDDTHDRSEPAKRNGQSSRKQ